MEPDKRKIQDVVRGIIGDGFKGTQSEIRDKLATQGYNTDQSTVSRTLKKIAAIKTLIDGKPGYIISNSSQSALSSDLSNLIIEIVNNETMIVIKTKPASAMFVAGFLDHHKPGDLLGTVAGDDTIFIVPKSTKQVGLTCHNIKEFLKQ